MFDIFDFYFICRRPQYPALEFLVFDLYFKNESIQNVDLQSIGYKGSSVPCF